MKTSEMIAMLEENPKLKFTNNDNQIIAVIPHKPNMFHQKTSNGCWIYYEMVIRNDWELISEPVPSWEAVRAMLEEDKAIVCEGGRCGSCHFNSKENCGEVFNYECLKTGTWYIEEEN